LATGSLAFVALPAISALKANHAAADEQGAVQGALYASAALGSAIGPLLIGSWLFVAFTRREGGWPYFPEGALLGAAAIAAIAFAAACGLPTVSKRRPVVSADATQNA